jgi:hypothetical protein
MKAFLNENASVLDDLDNTAFIAVVKDDHFLFVPIEADEQVHLVYSCILYDVVADLRVGAERPQASLEL